MKLIRNRVRLGSLSAACLMALPQMGLAQLEETVVTAQKREQSLQDVPITMQAFSGEQMREMGVYRMSDVTELSPNVSISMQTAHNQSITIRGIGTSDVFASAPSSVGIYLDEVTMGAPFLTSMGIYDMKRVEILRGPQNTLFGRNTTGGAVNFISEKPEVGGGANGYLTATYGNFERIEFEGAYTFQLNDTMAFRLAGKSYDRDGIWEALDTGDDNYGDKDRKSLRGTLVWEPSDLTRVTFNARWGKEDSEIDTPKVSGLILPQSEGNFADGAFLGPLIPLQQVDFEHLTPTATNNSGQSNAEQANNWHGIYPTGSNRQELDAFGGYIKIEHEFDFATFVSITAYEESQGYFTVTSSGTGNVRPSVVSGQPETSGIIDMDQEFKQFSQELRLQSPVDQRLRWITGLYYFNEDAVLGQNVNFGPSNVLNAPFGEFCNALGIFGDECGPPVVQGGSFGLWAISQGLTTGYPGAGWDDILSYQIADMSNEVISPYFRVDFDITPSLTLNMGLRYTDDHKEMNRDEVGLISRAGYNPDTVFWDNSQTRKVRAEQIASGLAATTCVGNTGHFCHMEESRDDLDAEEWGGKIGLTWQINDDHMVYGNYSRGFRSGKFDIEFLHGTHTGFAITDADIETLDAYELGYKSTWFDNTLQVDLATFFYKWNNKQTHYVDPLLGPQVSNVPESEVTGFEAEVKWAPNESLLFSAGIGILDTEITKGSGLGSDEVGHELQNAPPESYNLTAIWQKPVGNGYLRLQANYHYSSEAKTYLAPTPYVDEIGGIEKLGIRGTYEFGDNQQYSIAVFGEDLLESRYCMFSFTLEGINGGVTCNGSEGTAMYGITAGIKFD